MATLPSTAGSRSLLVTSLPERRLNHLVTASRRTGLVVIAGRTGSGKEEVAAELLTRAFPPSERTTIALVSADTALPVKKLRDAGVTIVDTTDVRAALIQAVRVSPVAILVDDVRDPETVRSAVHVAQMGHAVFMVLHSVPDFADAAGRLKLLGVDSVHGSLLTIVTLERKANGARGLSIGFFTAAATLCRPLGSSRAAAVLRRAHPNTILRPKHPSVDLMDGDKGVGSPADVLKSFVAPEAVADSIPVDHSDPAFRHQVSELLELGWGFEEIRGILAIHGYVWKLEDGEKKVGRQANRRRTKSRAGRASKETVTRRRAKSRRRKQAAARRS